MHLFRLGKYLLVGSVVSEAKPFLTVEVQQRVTETSSFPVVPVKVRLSQAFVVNEHFDPPDVAEASDTIERYEALAHAALVPFVANGRRALGEVTLSGYSRSRGVFIEGKDGWLPLHSLLTNVQIGQTIALEAIRDRLKSLGLLEGLDYDPVSECSLDLSQPLNAYMKAEPFRDITTIGEGTSVGVCGYYKGCAVLDADGEMFWYPVEEASFYDKDRKDDLYYFQNQDSNVDGVPDPLQSLPSKTALAGRPSRSQDNWNSSPNLVKVSGHFSPVPTIRNDDYAILGESYLGTNDYEWDERWGRPELHDISGEPGLVPTNWDAKLLGHIRNLSTLTHLDPAGVDGVDQDYTGEYGGEYTGDGVVSASVSTVEGGAVGAPSMNAPPPPKLRAKTGPLSTDLGYYEKEMLRTISKGKVPERLDDLTAHDTAKIFGGLKSDGYIGPNDQLTLKGKAALKESGESPPGLPPIKYWDYVGKHPSGQEPRQDKIPDHGPKVSDDGSELAKKAATARELSRERKKLKAQLRRRKSTKKVREASEPVMEPGFVKTPEDEKRWSRAKAAAKKQNPDDFYALANHIFHQMKKESVLEAIDLGADLDHVLSGAGAHGTFQKAYDEAVSMLFGHEETHGEPASS